MLSCTLNPIRVCCAVTGDVALGFQAGVGDALPVRHPHRLHYASTLQRCRKHPAHPMALWSSIIRCKAGHTTPDEAHN